MANLITLLRLLLVFVISALALYATSGWQFLTAPLITVNILLDGLDGFVARKCHATSVFGAILDIAADRIMEITLWIILAQLKVVPIWIALIFLTRGILVDSLRKPHTTKGHLPFSMMQTSWGKFLVGSRTMRFAFGFMKLITFSWLFFLIPATNAWPHIFSANQVVFNTLSNILVATTLIICLARGIPVILEAVMAHHHKAI